jgi:aminoglycoside phosphotransferase
MLGLSKRLVLYVATTVTGRLGAHVFLSSGGGDPKIEFRSAPKKGVHRLTQEASRTRPVFPVQASSDAVH